MIADEDSENESERICDRIALSQCINRLPPTWKKIVLMRYYRNMTQQQTANLLGLSQVKISREEKKILSFLKEELS
jgi:RNA polymerase sporulation-specific sigma factor